MKARSWPFVVLVAWLAACSGCQNTEQSSVQPEKLASSSPTAATEGTGAPSGPLVPFASGHGPDDLKAPTEGETASADPEADAEDDGPEFNPDGPTPPAAKPAPTPKTKTGTASSKPKPGVVKLLDAGAKPRTLLRFAPEVGQVSAVEMIMNTSIEMEVDGKKPPTGTVPPIVFIMQLKVTKVAPSGDIHYSFDVTEAGVRAVPGVKAQVITTLNRALGSLVGLTGHAVLSDRGITKETELSLPGKQNAQTAQVLQGMEQAMQQLGAPLPKEEVGKGAKWTHTTTLVQNGISLEQVATYELAAIKGKQVVLKIKLKQSAPKQKVASPVGVTVDLMSLKSRGKGESRLRLDSLTPVKSKMKVDTRAKMGLPDGKSMKMNSTLTVEMAKPKAKAPKKKAKPTKPQPAAPSGP